MASSKSWQPVSLDLYTAAETAAILGVNENLVVRWIKEGKLPMIRLGPGQRLIRIRREDLEQFIEDNFQSSTPPGQGGVWRKDSDKRDVS